MATDNKCCPYSFYVPAKDQALCDFLEAQSNLSMTIRLLLKAFLANYDTEYPDVTTMDLRELLNNMIVDPEKMLAKSQNSQAGKNPNKNEGLVAPKPVVQKAEPVTDSQTEVTVKNVEPVEEIVDVAEEVEDNTPAEENIAVETKVEEVKVEEKEPEKVEVPVVEDQVDDDLPEITVEPEVPKKTIGSARDDYNAKQNAGNDASMDDIMAMLGGE